MPKNYENLRQKIGALGSSFEASASGRERVDNGE